VLDYLRETIYVHQVVVIKGQHDLVPAKQFEFLHRMDPNAEPVHGTGTALQFIKTGGVLSKNPVHHVPNTNVRLVGAGYQGEDHYGLKNIHIQPLSHTDFQASTLSADQIAAGQTRFMGWHCDGLFYGAHPSRMTALRCIKAPKGPDLTIRWDDGSGLVMKSRPGRTAYFNSNQLYNLLDEEEKSLVDNSRWEAAPYPFLWNGTRKARTTGIGLSDQGDVLPLEALPEWTQDKVQRVPMVWLNPVTGKKALQIHPSCVRKLYLKSSPAEEERVVEDLEEIRSLLNSLFDRVVKPDYILIPPTEEGDVLVWNNWGVMHSAVEYPSSYGPRIMHQTHVASSTPPRGPEITV